MTTEKVVAKIAAVSDTKGTGITDRLAAELWPQLEYSFPVIATLRVSERTEDGDGPKSLKLEIDSIEPTHDDLATEHLRALQRALYMARNPQPMLGDEPEATVRDIVLGIGNVRQGIVAAAFGAKIESVAWNGGTPVPIHNDDAGRVFALADGAHCLECLFVDEDPRPWCDCAPAEFGTTFEQCSPGPCRNRAHEHGDCPTLAKATSHD